MPSFPREKVIHVENSSRAIVVQSRIQQKFDSTLGKIFSFSTQLRKWSATKIIRNFKHFSFVYLLIHHAEGHEDELNPRVRCREGTIQFPRILQYPFQDCVLDPNDSESESLFRGFGFLKLKFIFPLLDSSHLWGQMTICEHNAFSNFWENGKLKHILLYFPLKETLQVPR